MATSSLTELCSDLIKAYGNPTEAEIIRYILHSGLFPLGATVVQQLKEQEVT